MKNLLIALAVLLSGVPALAQYGSGQGSYGTIGPTSGGGGGGGGVTTNQLVPIQFTVGISTNFTLQIGQHVVVSGTNSFGQVDK